jgi:aldose sugar dehydrogenase
LGNSSPLSDYYAYGIRNSFGMDFDPVTGELWDTENGPAYGDEINLVKAGFNSGWNKVQGIWKPQGNYSGEVMHSTDDLITFDGKGKYGAPKFVWYQSVAPTALRFLNSDKLGTEYENDMFVGDYLNGYLYHLELEQNRTDLKLDVPLADKVANNTDELQSIVFGQGLGRITDIQVGPDGYLYVLVYHSTHGGILRISPLKNQSSNIVDTSRENITIPR